MRYAAKVDGNQAQIVSELRQLGFDVDVVHRQKRMYDLVVSGLPRWPGYIGGGIALRVEIKMPGEKLAEAEEEYWSRQDHANLLIASCTRDILDWFGWHIQT